MATPATNPRRGFLAAAACLATCLTVLHAQVPEPETVFYGRVVNRTSGQEFQVTTGALKFTVTGAGVAPLEVTTQLQALGGGRFSYLLRIPHQAKSLDLTVQTGNLPLLTDDTGYQNSSITVDGLSARPLGTATTEFVASQARRGGVHRLDLEVFNTLEDTDGDGIPDWWEDLHGLDKQDRSDALLRWGSGAYTNLDAFRLGLNPNRDDRVPELLTSELTVVEKGVTGILLRTVASASTPVQIRYRVGRLPDGGDLILRNARPDPKHAHRVLKVGDGFTQADVNAGLLEFSHKDSAVAIGRLNVAITTAGTGQPPVDGSVQLQVFRPEATDGLRAAAQVQAVEAGTQKPAGSAAENWRRRATSAFESEWTGGKRQQDWIAATLLSRWFDFTVWDGTRELPTRDLRVPSAGMTTQQYSQLFLKVFGPARQHVMFAGGGVVRVEGGMNGDVLVAGRDESTLKGNGGADVFVASEGTTIVEDFKAGEGDMLDLSPLLNGWPGPFGEKVRVSFNAGNTWLRLAIGSGRDAVVILKGLNLTAEKVETMRRRGQVFSRQLLEPSGEGNAAPVAVDDEGYVSGGQLVTIAVLANDSDPDGDALALKNASQAQHGTVNVVNDVVVYNPGPTFTGSDRFIYTVEDGRGGFSEGVVRITYPFPAAAGRYVSLITNASGAPFGQLSLNLLRGGSFSASVRSGGVTYVGKGSFDSTGAATILVKHGRKVLELLLSLNLEDPAYPLTGSVMGAFGVAQLSETVASASSTLVRGRARRFTLATTPLADGSAYVGAGSGAVSLSTSYSASFTGRLPDGTSFTASSVQDRLGYVRWSASLYRGAGWAIGRLSTAGPAATLRWSRPASGAEPAAVRDLGVLVSIYTAPSVAAVSALDFTDVLDRRADVGLSAGGLSPAVSVEVRFGARDVVRVAAPLSSLTLNRSNGLFSGRVVVDGKPKVISGAVLQNVNQGHGLFINGTATGSVTLSPR